MSTIELPWLALLGLLLVTAGIAWDFGRAHHIVTTIQREAEAGSRHRHPSRIP